MKPPHQFFGHERGASPARDHEIRRYVSALAAGNERVKLAEYGLTAGGRGLFVLTISSPANIAQLPDIEARLRELDELRADEPRAREIIGSTPAVVWFGCGIHGDELSGPDAALELAHRLATATDPLTLSWLEALIIHIDPLVNPEGRERLLAHTSAYARRVGPVDPQDIFHNALWPEGRGNQYLFDLNRDAVFTVQPESRARVAAVTRAMPQLYIDVHEMAADDTYLFAVPADPLNPHLPPAVHDSWRDFAADHAAEFDRDGTSYYTRSWNEVFYPGFFDVWPAYHGAVPILYEQSATNGGSVRLPNGRLRGYAEALDTQLRSASANLATAQRVRAELIARWHHARTVRPAFRHWIIAANDAYKLREVRRLLLAQGIRVRRLVQPHALSGLRGAWDDASPEILLPADSLAVSTDQPLGALVCNLFDFHVPCSREFLERERRGLDLGARTALFDVTAWSLPLAFGLDCWWTGSAPGGEWESVETASIPSITTPGEERYGYLLRDPSLHGTARLLTEGVRVRVLSEALCCKGERFAAGSLLIRGDDQALDIRSALEQEVLRGDAAASPVDSARILDGPDLGGRDFPLLAAPGIGILTGPGFSAPGTGALWHLFDAAIGVPATLLEFARLESLDLANYNVLLLPEPQDAQPLARDLGGGRGDRLRGWVENGGTLVAIGKASFAMATASIGSLLLRSAALERYPPLSLGRSADEVVAQDFICATGAAPRGATSSPEGVTPPVIGHAAATFVDKDTPRFQFPDELASASNGARQLRYLPRGAYLSTELKPAHWLRYGIGSGSSTSDRLAVLCRESDALIADANGLEVIARYSAPRDLALSGLVWPEAVGFLAGTAYFTRERRGSGQIISFAGDPVFRGYSLGTQRLLLNAVVFGPGFRRL